MNKDKLSWPTFLKLSVWLLLIISLLPEESSAQRKHNKKSSEFIIKGDDNCVYWPEYTRERRLKFYPFNIADSIKIVSFRNHGEGFPIDSNKIIAQDSLIEQKVLDIKEVDVLTDILYNNFYREPSNIGTLAMCFEPRNAILFLDKTGNLKEYIIICFHCDEMKLSADKIESGSKCSQKMDKLRIFFMASHIYFGTDVSVLSYPGESSNADVVAPPIK